MATFRQTINRVLIALGHADDQVDAGATSLTDNYHIKVAQTINDILEEVEQAAQWRALLTRDTATIAADGQGGTMTNANSRARVFHVHDAHYGELLPLVFDVTDTSDQKRLREMEFTELLRRDQENSNASESGGPTHYAIVPNPSQGMALYVHPRPNTQVNIEADLVLPQSRLPHTTSEELDTVIKVPVLPVVLGAEWWLREDRGEEFGPNGGESKNRYLTKLADAVALEHAQQGLDDLVMV